MEPVYRQTLHQKVYENLRAMILEGTILPGTKLNEAMVAKEMNTSTTPVREAFRMLQSDGLVKMEPWKGVIVMEYTRKEIIEAFQCREALEVLGMELTIERIKNCNNPGAAIKRVEYEMNMAEKAKNAKEFIDINAAIHNIWVEGSGNRRLVNLMEGLKYVFFFDKTLTEKNKSKREEILSEHIAILDGMRNFDTEKAIKALRVHLRNGMGFCLLSLEENMKRGIENGKK